MCVKWIARESSPLFCWAMVVLGTNATSSGCSLSRYQAILCAWSATSSLCRLHSFHFETYGLQGYIPFRLRLFVFVNALHSVVKPPLCSSFITTLRFIQTIASLKGFDHTIRSITRSVFTPRVLHERQATTLLS